MQEEAAHGVVASGRSLKQGQEVRNGHLDGTSSSISSFTILVLWGEKGVTDFSVFFFIPVLLYQEGVTNFDDVSVFIPSC